MDSRPRSSRASARLSSSSAPSLVLARTSRTRSGAGCNNALARSSWARELGDGLSARATAAPSGSPKSKLAKSIVVLAECPTNCNKVPPDSIAIGPLNKGCQIRRRREPTQSHDKRHANRWTIAEREADCWPPSRRTRAMINGDYCSRRWPTACSPSRRRGFRPRSSLQPAAKRCNLNTDRWNSLSLSANRSFAPWHCSTRVASNESDSWPTCASFVSRYSVLRLWSHGQLLGFLGLCREGRLSHFCQLSAGVRRKLPKLEFWWFSQSNLWTEGSNFDQKRSLPEASAFGAEVFLWELNGSANVCSDSRARGGKTIFA